MARKVLGNAVTDANERNGDSLHFGTADIDQINNYLSGQDQSTGDPTLAVTINTTTTFGSGKLASTNASITTPTLVGSGGTLTLPAGPDTVVGRNTTDTLKNKDVTDASNTFPSSLATLTTTQTLTHKNLTDATNTFPTSLATVTGVQSLTNKNLTDATNTFPSSLVTTTGTQTLTGKTIDHDLNTIKNYGPYKHIIYVAGSTYKAHNTATGVVDASGSTLDPVLSSVLNSYNLLTTGVFGYTSGGGVYIQSGNHVLSNSFAGWNIPPWTRIVTEPNCYINVPAGYTGYVFGVFETAGVYAFSPGAQATQGILLDGPYAREVGPSTHNWDGILLNPGGGGTTNTTNPGIVGNWFQNMSFLGAKNAIHLKVGSSNAYGNGNVFRNMFPNDVISAVLFDLNGFTYSTSLGFHRNMFQSIEGQGGSITTTGYKDIHGVANMFIDCKMWDLTAGQATANITSNANSTLILGGIMTSIGFTDSGVNSFIWDDIVGFKLSGKIGFNGKTPITQQANTAGNVTSTGGPTFGTTEQKMLNDAYTALRNFGLLS